MATLLEPAGAEVEELAAELIEAHHKALKEVEVSIRWQMAHAEVEDGKDPPRPLKSRGRALDFRVKVNSYASRVEGLKDATVTLDGDAWQGWGEELRRAIVDEALESLVVVTDKESGDFVTDNCGRPKLRIKETDIHIDTYEAVLKRHKLAAREAANLDEVFKRPVVQGLLSWG